MDFLYSFYFLLIHIGILESYIFPCIPIPDRENPIMIVCQGNHIQRFPDLSEEDRNIVEQILVFNTYITQLPTLTREMEYVKLVLFQEEENAILKCEYIHNWINFQPNTTFYSDCVNSLTQTSTNNPHSSIRGTIETITHNSNVYETTNMNLHTSTSEINIELSSEFQIEINETDRGSNSDSGVDISTCDILVIISVVICIVSIILFIAQYVIKVKRD